MSYLFHHKSVIARCSDSCNVEIFLYLLNIIIFIYSIVYKLAMVTFHSPSAVHYVAKILKGDSMYFFDGMNLATWSPTTVISPITGYTPSMVYYISLNN